MPDKSLKRAEITHKKLAQGGSPDETQYHYISGGIMRRLSAWPLLINWAFNGIAAYDANTPEKLRTAG